MIEFLAAAAKDARLKAGRKPYHVAVSAGCDPSTIWRFEQGRWPHDADELVNGYAKDLDFEPTVLWAEALRRWEESLNGNKR